MKTLKIYSWRGEVMIWNADIIQNIALSIFDAKGDKPKCYVLHINRHGHSSDTMHHYQARGNLLYLEKTLQEIKKVFGVNLGENIKNEDTVDLDNSDFIFGVNKLY